MNIPLSKFRLTDGIARGMPTFQKAVQASFLFSVLNFLIIHVKFFLH